MMNRLVSIRILSVLFFAVLIQFSLIITGEQQFSYLAQSFLHGKLYFLEEPGVWIDATFFEGNYYWPLGVFPVFLLLPFVYLFNLFGLFFYQGFLHPFLVLGVYFLCYLLARHFSYSKGESFIWAFGFTFSSVFLNVAMFPWSWWFAQVIAVLLTLLLLYEYHTKKRFWIMGILIACAFLTRSTLIFLSVFILMDILMNNKFKILQKVRQALIFLLPVVVGIVLFLGYNYFRFGNPLEQGYQSQALLTDDLSRNRGYGIVSPVHIPGNLYYFLVSSPLPVFIEEGSRVLSFPYIKANPWGMSIFITSPWILYLFAFSYKDKKSFMFWLAIICIAVPIFLYYGIGYRQFGYRYSLDFMPLLFVLLLWKYKEKYKELSFRTKILLIVPAFTNLFFFLTLFLK